MSTSFSNIGEDFSTQQLRDTFKNIDSWTPSPEEIAGRRVLWINRLSEFGTIDVAIKKEIDKLDPKQEKFDQLLIRTLETHRGLVERELDDPNGELDAERKAVLKSDLTSALKAELILEDETNREPETIPAAIEIIQGYFTRNYSEARRLRQEAIDFVNAREALNTLVAGYAPNESEAPKVQELLEKLAKSKRANEYLDDDIGRSKLAKLKERFDSYIQNAAEYAYLLKTLKAKEKENETNQAVANITN